uniref:SGTA homodimerisation domain-containing protein n=1 Tax=Romanomermis culicivorax TaxID=13658 RepID=A0A915IP48_ROMCU
MTSLQERKLIIKIIDFFRSKISSGQLESDQVESLEVALQCLESTFNVNVSDPALQTNVDLLSLFVANVKEKTLTEEAKQQAETLKNEGNNLMKDAKYEEAIQKYSEAIKLHSNPIFFCNRAAAFSKAERHLDAVEDCKIALQLDPSYSKAYGRMGLAYTSLRKFKEARDAYKKALELEPNNESFENNLNIAEEKLREAEQQQTSAGSFPSGFPNFGGAFNPFEMLNNPAFAQMAQQVMSDPNIINMMGNMFGGTPPTAAAADNVNAPTGGSSVNSDPNNTAPNPTATGGGLAGLLQMGQQFASMMQQQNPDLVDQLRRQFQGQNDQDGPPNPDPNTNH